MKLEEKSSQGNAISSFFGFECFNAVPFPVKLFKKPTSIGKVLYGDNKRKTVITEHHFYY